MSRLQEKLDSNLLSPTVSHEPQRERAYLGVQFVVRGSVASGGADDGAWAAHVGCSHPCGGVPRLNLPTCDHESAWETEPSPGSCWRLRSPSLALGRE